MKRWNQDKDLTELCRIPSFGLLKRKRRSRILTGSRPFLSLLPFEKEKKRKRARELHAGTWLDLL
jgi:hypothetical protein